MQFWFCETCGKRLSDKDLEEGAARNKKLKGVFCRECAVGVMTMEMDAINIEQLAKEKPKAAGTGGSTPPGGTKGSASNIAVAQSGSKTNLKPSSRLPVHGHVTSGTERCRKTP
jgi:hypothetical protein